ncbi:glutamine synthetase family protein [Pendulispora brunnea]|uniref:Glutamine synthetase family protein n=1 Tax=Pendulispora brunnea TaxID=2905690 RepID=A0ABZ2K762_9BACT
MHRAAIDPRPRLRLLWADLLGVERGKYLYGRRAEAGHTNFAVTTFVTTLDKTILPVAGFAHDVGLPDLQARIDPSSVRPGWEKDTVVGMSDLTRDGAPLAVCPRQMLRRACAPWIDAGLYPQLAFELEFYLLAPDGRGGYGPLVAPAPHVYGTGPGVDPDGVLDDMAAAAAGSGFPLEGFASEFDDAQFELNLGHRDALAAADDAFLLRLLVREVALRRGYRATFLGKPFSERAGTGMHVNLSFRTASGENALDDPRAKDGLSAKVHHATGGLLAHHEALAAVFAPNVNAYRRLRPHQMNGYWANWGYDDRTAAVRIPPERGAGARIEHRTPDGAANPYLVGAALLHAARFGVERELVPTSASDRTVPESLGAALDALEADTWLGAELGPDFVRAFTALKRAECDQAAELYLPFF